jgi:hypothetical protein
MDFREATAQLNALGVPYPTQADALGINYQTFRQMRMEPNNSPSGGRAGARTPPPADEWKPALAQLARERAEALGAFATTV